MRLESSRLLAATLVLATGSAFAQSEPVLDIDPARHGNLAAAQQLVRGAYDKLGEAQYANHDELGGHAARAKELLRQASEEIKAAAIAANHR